jgi:ribose transport system substrate-binding protein
VTKRPLTARPEVGVIFCASALMARGALQHLDEAGRMVVTVDQQAAQQGYLGTRYARALLKAALRPGLGRRASPMG